jgi:hypothetical protein
MPNAPSRTVPPVPPGCMSAVSGETTVSSRLCTVHARDENVRGVEVCGEVSGEVGKDGDVARRSYMYI